MAPDATGPLRNEGEGLVDEARRAIAAVRWRPCSEAYATQVGPHEYIVRKDVQHEWDVIARAIDTLGSYSSYMGKQYMYLVVGDRRYWHFEVVLNRARLVDVEGMESRSDGGS